MLWLHRYKARAVNVKVKVMGDWLSQGPKRKEPIKSISDSMTWTGSVKKSEVSLLVHSSQWLTAHNRSSLKGAHRVSFCSQQNNVDGRISVFPWPLSGRWQIISEEEAPCPNHKVILDFLPFITQNQKWPSNPECVYCLLVFHCPADAFLLFLFFSNWR